jgi:hypothetical protein
VTKEVEGKLGIALAGHLRALDRIVNHSLPATLFSHPTQLLAPLRTSSMASQVVREDLITGLRQSLGERLIAPGVLRQSVGDLDDPAANLIVRLPVIDKEGGPVAHRRGEQF